LFSGVQFGLKFLGITSSKTAMVRIGILVKDRRMVVEENDFVPCEHLEWTKRVPQKFRCKRVVGKRQKYGDYGIQTDIAIIAYIQHALKLKDVEVDLILPGKVSKERLRANDLNFVLQYGMLEAHYMDKSRKLAGDKKQFKQLKACLQAKNVYPPLDYQELCMSKVNYYSYLQENDLSVLPTFTMTSEEYEKLGHDLSMKKMFEFWGREELDTVIAKPVLGMGGADVEFFKATEEGRSFLGKYFRKCMSKYPGLIVQKSIKGFGAVKESPELRMYFLGDKYKYSVSANANAVCSHPKAEGGTLEVPMDRLEKVTRKIVKNLPQIVMPNGAHVPRLVTRLDMGWRVDGKCRPFLNEIELTPSYYVYKPLKENLLEYISGCAKQIVKITRQYMKGCRPSGKVQRDRSHAFPRMGRSQGSNSRRVSKHHFLKHRPFSAKS